MSKNRDKHHLPEEAKKNARAAGEPAPAGVESAQEAPPGQEVKPAVELGLRQLKTVAGLGEAGPGSATPATTLASAGQALKFPDIKPSGASQLQKAAQEIDQLKDKLLRLRADFENYRKRVLREKGEIYENANEALMLELLPIIDHLQLAISSAKEHQADKAFQEGLRLIADQLMTVFAKYGLNQFNSEKQPFDANLHEAISYLPSETEPEGTILAQSRQGYRFKNKLLRPAQVVVSSGRSTPPPQAEIKEKS